MKNCIQSNLSRISTGFRNKHRAIILIIIFLQFFLIIFHSFQIESHNFNSNQILREEQKYLDSDLNLPKPLVGNFNNDTDNNGENGNNGNEDGDNDNDGINNDIEDQNKREVQIEIQEGQVQIESKSTSSGIENQIQIQIEYQDDGIKFKTEFYSDSDVGQMDISFSIRFQNIYEYNDIDGNGMYNDSIDELLQTYLLDEFTEAKYLPIIRSDSSVLHYINVSTSDFIFTIHAYISEEFQIIQNTTLTPTELKMDIEINNFPYISEISLLALQAKLEAEGDFKEVDETEDEQNDFAKDERGLSLKTNEFSGFFSWSEYSMIDGVKKRVKSSSIVSENDNNEPYFYFNYDHGTSIYHDPKIGIMGLLNLSPVYIPEKLFDFLLWSLIGFIGTVGITILMTKSEYIQYLLNRKKFMIEYHHRLSMEDVLENNFRDKIIETVLEHPGIHYKELFREINTSPSNFAWHLDILETYKIIKKQRLGQYLIYYPYNEINPFEGSDPTIFKSRTSLHILDFITEEPGITQNILAFRLNKHKKTIQYHLDKLLKAEMIKIEKKGRKNHYFVIEDSNIGSINNPINY